MGATGTRALTVFYYTGRAASSGERLLGSTLACARHRRLESGLICFLQLFGSLCMPSLRHLPSLSVVTGLSGRHTRARAAINAARKSKQGDGRETAQLNKQGKLVEAAVLIGAPGRQGARRAATSCCLYTGKVQPWAVLKSSSSVTQFGLAV